jgi:hypothetical protein
VGTGYAASRAPILAEILFLSNETEITLRR